MSTSTNKIVKKTQREHVLDRPDTYIGTVRYGEVDRLVAEDVQTPVEESAAEGGSSVPSSVTTTRIVQKRVSFCPGLTQLFMEILNNARDRTVVTDVDVRCTRVEVGYDASSGTIWVQNNGDGVSVEVHPTYGVYNPELIFGHLLTSTNYDDSERRIVGGRNGFGAKLTNIYSSQFTVETVDARTRRKYVQTWSNNMATVGAPVVTEGVKSRPLTKVTWTFDHARFGKTNVVDADFIAVMHKAVIDIAATVGTKVTVTFQGKEITCDNLVKYLDMFPQLAVPTCAKVHSVVNDRWKVAVATVPPEEGYRAISFVNGMWTAQGGTHESLVVNQVVDALSGALHSRAKGADRALVDGCKTLNRIIKDRIWVFVDACIENPEFASQTKECLKSPVREFGSTCELPTAFLRKVAGLDVVDAIMDQLRGKSQASMKATDGRKVSNISGIPKLDDAPWAGTRRSNECVLIVTEGDSAKATAIAGLAARRDRERFGVFALRGKIRNVTDAPAADLNKTEGEFYYLKKILGLQQGKTYETEADIKTLRYSKLIVFTDQDTDGFHIKALVMNIFARFWPHLLRTGFVQSLPTPLIKATKGKQILPFFSMPAFRAWALGSDTNGWKIKYYKGLGTSTKEDALEYFKGFGVTEYVERPRATLHAFFGSSTSAGAGNTPPPVEDTTDLFLNLFSKDRTDYRKTWVQAFNPEAALDNSRKEVTLAEFLHTEYRSHADDNLRRTTPSVVDGLKPSQRKILFGCFRKGLDVGTSEMKVAQLGAAVAEITSYHHGEVSLMSSITKMAQTFVGSNNINLLEPLGQFGTRLEGGDDAASARYIFTRISSLAKLIFRKEDNPILEYLEDEGNSIEPVEYLPLIPMVLVNGADGIGTGFSTKVPPSNPLEVIANVRNMIRSGGVLPDEVPYMPWWNKFTGTVIQDSAEKYIVRGVYETDGACVRISELPVGTWSSPYKAFLEELVSQGKIAGFEWPVDDERVSIRVDMVQPAEELTGIDAVTQALEFEANPAAAAAAKRKAVAPPTEDVEKLFKLANKISTSNVHLYTSGKISHIKKYTIREIYSDFFAARLAGYEKRKAHILSCMEHDHRVARARIVFIESKLSGRLVLENRPDDAVQADLASLGLPLAHELGLKSSGYDYLMDMKLRSLTRTKVEALRAEVLDLETNIARVRATPVEVTWMNELNELECKMLGRPFVPEEVAAEAPVVPVVPVVMEVDELIPTGPIRKRRGVLVSSA